MERQSRIIPYGLPLAYSDKASFEICARDWTENECLIRIVAVFWSIPCARRRDIFFSAGLATTYSLDLTTLLSVPLHLALRSSDDRNAMLQDGVALLEALRRTTDRLSIFCQQGRIAAPNLPHVLSGLLESCVVEVTAPHGGVFHPKIWVLRFKRPDKTDDVVLRLLVLSRNLTGDSSWDLSLSLDGTPGKRTVAQNRPLSDLVAALPELAASPPVARIRQDCETLANELRQTTWSELPGAFEELAFHTLGFKRRSWCPKPSKRLAVISPFVSASALHALAATTQEAVVLVSRPDELAKASKASLARFGALKVLHEGAETDDGDDASRPTVLRADCTRRHTSSRMVGHHALPWVCERDKRFIGGRGECRDPGRTYREAQPRRRH